MPGIGIGLGLGMGRASPAPAPPDPYGPELIVNGTFDGDSVSPWQANGATLSIEDGRLKIVVSGSNEKGAYQVITTKTGATYRVAADLQNDAAAANANVSAQTTSFTNRVNSTSVAAGTSASLEFEFTATTDETRIDIRRLNAGQQVGDTLYVDNVSVREVLMANAILWGTTAILWGAGSPITWA